MNNPTLALTLKSNEVLVVGEARITMRHRRGKYHVRVCAPKNVRITREKPLTPPTTSV